MARLTDENKKRNSRKTGRKPSTLVQFSFSSQPVTVTPLEKLKAQETPRQRDIVYFDRQRPHQKPDYSKARDQDLRTARNNAKT